MDGIIRWLKHWFRMMFVGRPERYKRQLEARVRHATVGKAQQKMNRAMQGVDRKVNKAQDKAFGGRKKQAHSGPASPAQASQQAKAAMPEQAPGHAPAFNQQGPAPQGAPQQGYQQQGYPQQPGQPQASSGAQQDWDSWSES